eukprot:4774388-Prymnesium_polylepis.1
MCIRDSPSSHTRRAARRVCPAQWPHHRPHRVVHRLPVLRPRDDRDQAERRAGRTEARCAHRRAAPAAHPLDGLPQLVRPGVLGATGARNLELGLQPDPSLT